MLTKPAFLSLALLATTSASITVAQEQASDFTTQEFRANWALLPINTLEAWTLGFTGKGVTVGIADGPMQFNHPEFEDRVTTPRPAPAFPLAGFDVPQHGTHVAGIAAAARNGSGMMGVAFDANIAHARATGATGYPQNLNWADLIVASGASVVNGSFGPELYPKRYIDDDEDLPNPNWVNLPYQMITPDYVTQNIDSVRTLAEADVVMVFSAGNEFFDQPTGAGMPDGEAMFPLITPQNTANGDIYRFVSDGTDVNDPDTWIPSTYEEVGDLDFSDLAGTLIAVTAVDVVFLPEASAYAALTTSFGNRCGAAASWCLAAPGVDIYSTVPIDGYGLSTGSSMAAPLVAGTAALVRQAFPYMTARQVIEVVLTTASSQGFPEIFGHGLLNAGRAVRGPINLGSDPIFSDVFAVDTAGHNSTWSNDISGVGAISKAGAGTLRLTGQNTYTGPTLVTGGELQVDGAIALSRLTVGADATVSGRGILGPTFLMGNIAPGNSIGTLLVNGDLTFASGSTFTTELGANGTSDLIAVNGDVRILPGATILVAADGIITPGQSYVVLRANGAVTGRFDAVRDPYLFMDFTTTQVSSTLSVTSERNATPMAAFALDANQAAVAQAIDSLPMASVPGANLLSATSATAAQTFFTAYSGEIYASQKSVHLAEAGRLSQALARRMAKGRPPAGRATRQGISRQGHPLFFWAQPYGTWGEFSDPFIGNRVSYSGQGLAYGAELEGESGLRVGLAIAVSDSHVNVAASTSSTDAQHLMIYGAADLGAFRLGGGLTQSWLQSDVRRSLPYGTVASASLDSSLTQAFTELSLPQTINSNFSWAPYLHATYSWLRQKPFLETGSDAALAGSGEITSTGTLQIGARVHHSWTVHERSWDFDASASLKRAWGDTSPTAKLSFATGSMPFAVRAPDADETSFALDLGLGTRIGKTGLLDVGLSSEWGRSQERHAIKASLKVVF